MSLVGPFVLLYLVFRTSQFNKHSPRAVTEINAFWLSDNKLRIQAACPEARKGGRPLPLLIPLSVLLYRAVIIGEELRSVACFTSSGETPGDKIQVASEWGGVDIT